MFVFIDASSADNKDLSSQIGHEIIIASESLEDDFFLTGGNLIHWSSTKSRRATRSDLVSEIYGMTRCVDMAIALSTTVAKILN